jgi:hypothetical protein
MQLYKTPLKIKGSIIITVLFLAVILIIYATALVGINQNNLRMIRKNKDKLAAQQMAEAGINDTIHKIFLNPNFGKNQEVLEYSSTENPEQGYRITFNPKESFYSVNNLDNPAHSLAKNFEGKSVAGNTIDIVSVGIAGKDTTKPTEHKIQIILRRDLTYGLSIGAMKQISANGRVEIDGIRSMLNLDSKIPGTIHSNHDLLRSSPEGPSIRWTPGLGGTIGDFVLGGNSVITTVGEVSSNLLPKKPRESEPKKIFPVIPVSSIVKKKASSSPRLSDLKVWVVDSASSNITQVNLSMTYNPGNNSSYTGYINIGDLKEGYERYHKGNLVVNGDIALNNGTFYVDGNLTVNGGIKGNGSIYVTGDVNILGGNSTIVTNQIDSCSIFSDGNVNLAGLDARGYLEALAKQYPDTIGKAYYGDPNDKFLDGFKESFNAFTTFLDSKKKTGKWDFDLFEKHFDWPCNSVYSDTFDGIEPRDWLKPESNIDKDRLAAFLLTFAAQGMTNYFVPRERKNPEETWKYRWSSETVDWLNPLVIDNPFQYGRYGTKITTLIIEMEETLGIENINRIPEARRVHQALIELYTYFRPNLLTTRSRISKEMPWLDELYGEKDWHGMVTALKPKDAQYFGNYNWYEKFTILNYKEPLDGERKFEHVFWHDDHKPWKQHSMKHLYYHTANNFGLRDHYGYYNFPTNKIKLTYNEYFNMVRDNTILHLKSFRTCLGILFFSPIKIRP